MPKAPLKAQIVIGLFAVLMIAYGFSVIRLDEGSSGTRNALPGQLIVVRMHGSWEQIKSSDDSVVKTIYVSSPSMRTGYFLALRPGKATLSSSGTPCVGCGVRTVGWQVVVAVGPGG